MRKSIVVFSFLLYGCADIDFRQLMTVYPEEDGIIRVISKTTALEYAEDDPNAERIRFEQIDRRVRCPKDYKVLERNVVAVPTAFGIVTHDIFYKLKCNN